jgi:hypothetical protein
VKDVRCPSCQHHTLLLKAAAQIKCRCGALLDIVFKPVKSKDSSKDSTANKGG